MNKLHRVSQWKYTRRNVGQGVTRCCQFKIKLGVTLCELGDTLRN